MATFLVNKWLQEIPSNGTSLSTLLSNAGLSDNDKVVESIFVVLEDRRYHDELIELVCHHLFTYYRTNDNELRRFVLIFLPTLIGLHLTSCNNSSERKKYSCIEVLLLGIYNLEVIDQEDGQPITRSFRLPSLAKPSIYHEPSQHISSYQQPSMMLTEHALSRFESGGPAEINIPLFGPYNEHEHIVASNRMDILTVLLKIYNENISQVPKHSLNAVCRMCFKILRHGTNKNTSKVGKGNLSPQLPTRNFMIIPLSAKYLVELVNSIYFCIYNGVADAGLQALDEINYRAVNYLFTDVLLMTNAIRNSLLINPSGQPSDGSMGINVALSPTSSTSSEGVIKTAITNASFKTKKLPDDIPIVSSTTNQLTLINEENEGKDEGQTTKDQEQNKPKAIAGLKAGLGKFAMLKEKKERKKDLKDLKDAKDAKDAGKFEQKSNKIVAKENGDVIFSKIIPDDLGSDTSGVSDGRLSYTDEAIPLTIINSNTPYRDNDDDHDEQHHDHNDDHDHDNDRLSNSSINSDAALVPLVNTETSIQNSINKHNETSINV